MDNLNLIEADHFMKAHKGDGYNYFVANIFRQTFIKFDPRMTSLNFETYILKADDQTITLAEVAKRKLDIIKVDPKAEIPDPVEAENKNEI